MPQNENDHPLQGWSIIKLVPVTYILLILMFSASLSGFKTACMSHEIDVYTKLRMAWKCLSTRKKFLFDFCCWWKWFIAVQWSATALETDIICNNFFRDS